MPLIQEIKSSEDVEMEEPNVEVDITQVRYARHFLSCFSVTIPKFLLIFENDKIPFVI